MTSRPTTISAALVAASAWFGASGLVFGFLALPDRLTRRLPFGSPVVGGLALAVIIALPYTVLAVLASRGHRSTRLGCRVCGLVLIGWIGIELMVVREFSFLQPLLAAVGIAFVIASSRGAPARLNREPVKAG